MMFSVENFISGIHSSTNILVEQQEDKIILTRIIRDFNGSEDEQRTLAKIPLEEISNLCKELEDGYTHNDSALWTDNTYEVAVQAHDRMRMPPMRLNGNSLYEVSEHNYEFSVSPASINIFLL